MNNTSENNKSEDFNATEYLQNLHTKQLLQLRDKIYKITPSDDEKPIFSSEEQRYQYFKDSEAKYDVSNSFKNWYVTLNDVRRELKTREQIPNKAEAKLIRQQRAKNKIK